MGVRGVQTLLCGDKRRNIQAGFPNGCQTINIRDEIAQWKRMHPQQEAIIIIDAMTLTVLTARNQGDILCGGRHHQYFSMFDQLFSKIKSCDVKMVFFCDSNVHNQKIEQWLRRRNDDYARTIALYDQIGDGISVADILGKQDDNAITLTTVMNAVSTEALKYGEYIYVTQHECDLELAKYARDHNAIAVVSNDSDFHIFEGNWKYWSCKDIDLDTLDTIEYNRQALCDYLSLSYQQLPLWATLMGNDHTGTYSWELRNFHTRLGQIKCKFLNVARYVRAFRDLPFQFNQCTIDKIARDVFDRRINGQKRQSILDSIKSYDLDFIIPEITDPLLRQAVKHSSIYSKLTSDIHKLTLSKCNFRYSDIGKPYTDVMAAIERRAFGVIWRERKKPQATFQLLAKWAHTENYCVRETLPLYPPENIELPPLLTLLFEHDENIDSPLNTTRWQLLLWILSIAPAYLERIKGVQKEFRLIAIELLFMVQQSQITNAEADNILITEMMVRTGEANDYQCPTYLKSRFVHVAHIYGNGFKSVRHAFAGVGLCLFINKKFMFDGVAFHNLSDIFNQDPDAAAVHSPAMEKYRLYD